MTKVPETKEFIIVVQLASEGNLRSILSTNFNDILWKDKIICLFSILFDLKNLNDLS